MLKRHNSVDLDLVSDFYIVYLRAFNNSYTDSVLDAIGSVAVQSCVSRTGEKFLVGVRPEHKNYVEATLEKEDDFVAYMKLDPSRAWAILGDYNW